MTISAGALENEGLRVIDHEGDAKSELEADWVSIALAVEKSLSDADGLADAVSLPEALPLGEK